MYEIKLNLERKEFICEECGHIEAVPHHCHKPMNVIDDKLICWKGEHAPCCNTSSVLDIPVHHGKNMVLKD